MCLCTLTQMDRHPNCSDLCYNLSFVRNLPLSKLKVKVGNLQAVTNLHYSASGLTFSLIQNMGSYFMDLLCQ